MTQLKNILIKKNIKQSALAKLLNKDASTINRWAEDSRCISWDNAVGVAKIINCHPIEIFNDTTLTKVKLFCDNDCYVEDRVFDEDHKEIELPFELSNKIVVHNYSKSIEGGFHLFDNNEISINLINPNKIYLIYLENIKYCGYINVLKSGSYSVFNANNYETPILGNLSEIKYLYKRTHFQDE